MRVYRTFIYSLLVASATSFIGVQLNYPFSWWWVGLELVTFLICLFLKPLPQLLYLWTAISGFTSAPILSGLVKEQPHITWIAILTTCIIFTGLSVYVHYSKKDFSHWKGILFAALTLSALITILWIFIPNYTAEITWSAICILLFSCYVLFDTSNITEEYQPGEEASAAMDLHLDFINLFWNFIRLLIKRPNNPGEDPIADENIQQHAEDISDLLD